MARETRRWEVTMGLVGWVAVAVVIALVAVPRESPAGDVPGPVRDAVKRLVGNLEPDSVRAAPVPGFFEVSAAGEILYVSGDGRYLFHGNLYDVAKRRNLTEDTRRVLRRAVLDELDEDSLIVFAPAGRTKHRLVVFTDVDCPYCAKFHLEVSDLNEQGVEIRYAAWPRTPPGTESFDRSISVWCARDRHRAMTDAKAGRSIAAATCDNPVEEHSDIGVRLGVTGTPTLFTETGAVIGGYVPYRELVRRLERR